LEINQLKKSDLISDVKEEKTENRHSGDPNSSNTLLKKEKTVGDGGNTGRSKRIKGLSLGGEVAEQKAAE